jgi:hypothetical protein
MERGFGRWTVVLGLLWPALASAGAATRRGPYGRDTTYLVNESYLNLGALLGLQTREGGVVGALGVEFSVHHFTDSVWGAGVFAQWQSMHGGDSHRFCVGGQVTAPTFQMLGVEAGVAYETADTRRAPTLSLHVAPFVSVGALSLSLRLGLPVHAYPSELPGRRFEGGLNVALKIPIPLKDAPREPSR